MLGPRRFIDADLPDIAESAIDTAHSKGKSGGSTVQWLKFEFGELFLFCDPAPLWFPGDDNEMLVSKKGSPSPLTCAEVTRPALRWQGMARRQQQDADKTKSALTIYEVM